MLDRSDIEPSRGNVRRFWRARSRELQYRAADEWLQLQGGYGYTREHPVSRDFVGARVQRMYGGTSELMKELIARSILGR
jgi:acyl-CoA dehydrogenase